MSDYQESHSLSRLIGSPPGYVGYEDEDILVTPLRRRPSSVVLLEDFDQAHPRIQERLLRLIEEGEITDTRGHRAEATNAIFVLTFDARVDDATASIGFGNNNRDEESGAVDERAILESIDTKLADRVEDYLDAVIAFNDLSGGGESPAEDLLDQRIEAFVEAMEQEYKLEVEVTPEVRDRIVEAAEGLADVNDLEDLVTRWLYDPMTEALLADRIGERARVGWDDEAGSIEITTSEASEAE